MISHANPGLRKCCGSVGMDGWMPEGMEAVEEAEDEDGGRRLDEEGDYGEEKLG